jgi:hypothetical protein
VKWRDILAGYAVSVALNGILPANIGTLVFLIMITVLIGISFAAVLGAYAVEKIFFTLSGTFVYVYLFFTSAARSTSRSAGCTSIGLPRSCLRRGS